jgi:hypothetical protein
LSGQAVIFNKILNQIAKLERPTSSSVDFVDLDGSTHNMEIKMSYRETLLALVAVGALAVSGAAAAQTGTLPPTTTSGIPTGANADGSPIGMNGTTPPTTLPKKHVSRSSKKNHAASESSVGGAMSNSTGLDPDAAGGPH